MERRLQMAPDKQVSLPDPDSRSMATSGRGSGVVGYNVQVAVETQHHLIIAHEVTNVGSGRPQLADTAKAAKEVLEVEELEAVADRGYFNGEEIKECDDAGIAVTLPKPQTSGTKAEGRFGKQDFVYLASEDVYRCPASKKLKYYYTKEEDDRNCLLLDECLPQLRVKAKCTTGKERRISRWEHEDVLEKVQERLDRNPNAMRTRRETVEHPFGTLKMRMGETYFLCTTLPKVATEMALCVLGYNLTRVINIVGVEKLLAAMRGRRTRPCGLHGRRQRLQERSTRLANSEGPNPTRLGNLPRTAPAAHPDAVRRHPASKKWFLHGQDPMQARAGHQCRDAITDCISMRLHPPRPLQIAPFIPSPVS